MQRPEIWRIIPLMVKKKIRDTIRKNNLINSGEHIVIGLSGGPDSVCLFSVLKELSGEMGFTLHAVHVNHGLRPGAAEDDQTYVEAICRESGVECRCFRYDCSRIASEEGMTDEEAGRKVRYEAFVQVANELAAGGKSVRIAVAQNADDQAETVLFRLLRGTGTDGLAGMAYSRMEQNICVIRPLLDTWRSEIEEYCAENNLVPRIDHTNLQPVYTRNKIRLQLIPYLEENFNPNIMEALTRLSRTAGEDKEYLWRLAEEAYKSVRINDGLLDQQGLRELARPVKYRVIMKAFSEIGLMQDIQTVHLEAADSILSADGESKEAAFPGGYRMIVRYGEVAFVAPDHEECYQNITFSVRVLPNEENEAAGNTFGDQPRKNNDMTAQAATFDYEKVAAVFGPDPRIEFRSRRAGDFLPVKNGRKKLQDLLVDEKVPKELRDKVEFAAIGSEILWIPQQPELGIIKNRYNPKYKLDMDTKKVLQLELICEI